MNELIRREDAINATWQEPSYTDPYNVLTEVRDRINALPTASPWHRVEEPPKEDGWYILGFLSRWKGGNWWMPKFPDYWMTAEPPKEEENV